MAMTNKERQDKYREKWSKDGWEGYSFHRVHKDDKAKIDAFIKALNAKRENRNG